MSQSVGLVDALAVIEPLNVVMVKGRARIRGWLRPLVRFLMGKKGRPLPDVLLRRIAEIEIPANSPAPDLIVSSGGKSVFAARTLAVRHAVPYVFIGERKPYPAEWFHTVVSPVPRESSANSIDVELIPTPVTPALIAQKGEVEPGLWCMVIGGTSRTHLFEQPDWENIALAMNNIARRNNVSWLITTSRRTGAEAEAIIQERLDSSVVEDAIWWGENPSKELYSFMARAEVIFVTQDSVTMVTEAVSAGKPVVALRPAKVHFPESSFLPVYFERLENRRRIKRMAINEMPEMEFSANNFSLIKDPPLYSTARELAQRLGW